MSVRVHIDRLVVDGPSLTARERSTLAEAIQRELGERLATRSRWPAADVRVRRVRGVPLAAGPSFASGIAGALDRGIRQVTAR